MPRANDIADERNGVRRRHWHDLRPQPRRRSDLMGFNSALWMGLSWVALLLAVVFPYPWW